MSKIKQIVAMLLTVLLLISAIPATSLTAFAAETEVSEVSAQSDVFRVRLTWNATPRDLDSHLTGENSAGNSFHVYYGNKNAYDSDGSLLANLDVDDTSGYGPENVTIFKSLPNKTFRYYVHNYSGEAPVNGCGAVVELYKNDVLIGRYTPPANSGNGRYWNIFQILNGNVYVVNKIGDSPTASTGKVVNVNAGNLNVNNIVVTPKIAADDDNDLSFVASDVQMKKSSDGSNVNPEANGSFVLDDSTTQRYSVTLSKNNYRNYVIPQTVLESWKKTDLGDLQLDTSSTPAIFHTSFLKKDRKDGKPYVSTVFCQKSSQVQNDISNAYVEIQNETININAKDKYNIVVSADGLGGKSCTYYIAQDKQRKISSTTGIFSAVDLYSVLDFQKKTYAYVVTEDNVTSELMPVNFKKLLESTENKVDDFFKDGKIGFLNKKVCTITIPKSVLLVGDAEISLDAFRQIPVGVDVDGNTVRVSIGANIFNSHTELKKNSPTKYKKWVSECFKDWKELFDTFNKDKKEKALQKFRDKYKLGGKGKTKDKNWDINTLGYVEFEFVDGEFIVKESSLSLDVTFEFEYTVQAAIIGVPVYFSFGAGGSAGATGTMTRSIADKSVPFEYDVTINLTPKVELGAGFGYKKALSVGVYAEATMPITFDIQQKHLQMKLTGEIGLEARLFVLSGKLKLLNGTINVIDKYFGTSAYSLRRPFAPESDEVEIEYSLQDRDYLQNTSEWLYGATSTYSLRSQYRNGLSLTPLQTSVYDNASPRVVAFGDKMLMTWVEDSAERDAYNRMRLMYSVYSDSIWSEPQPVCDDGFNDNAPIIVSDGTDVYFAWQKLCKTLTEDDIENADDITSYVEIYSAKYDAATGEICNVRRETSNENYDYAHNIFVVDGKAELFYVSNNDPETLTNNTICKTDFAENSDVIAENLNYILDIAVSEDADGNMLVSYLIDDDGDTSTTSDIKVYTYKPASNTFVDETAAILETKSEAEYTQIFISDIFYADFCGENTLFAVSGKEIFQLNSNGIGSMYVSGNSISGDVNYLVKNGTPMLFWTSDVECGNAVYCSSYENGEWSEPVAVSDTETVLTGVTVVNYGDTIKGVCTSSQTICDENEEYSVVTDLCAFDINDKYDVEIDYITIEEENIHIGEPTKFTVYVKNNGSAFVETLQFNVSDGLGYDVTTLSEVNLNPGQAEFFELEYTAPENYGRTELTVTAESDLPETDTENNVTSKEIGIPKIVVSDATVYTTERSYIVSAFVTNESDVPASGVEIVSKLDENVVHSSTIIESIQPRESCYVDFEIITSEIPFEDNCAKVFLTSESEEVSGNTISVLLEYVETECMHPLTQETIVDPTCAKDGLITTTCLGCNEVVEEEVIDAYGHDFNEDDICVNCNAERINENETKYTNLNTGEYNASYVFIPDSDEYYCVFSDSEDIVCMRIYDEETSALIYEDWRDSDGTFVTGHYFEKDVSYILEVEFLSNLQNNIPLTIAKYTPATGINILPEEYTGYINSDYQLSVSFTPANAIEEYVEWSSSSPDCAEVDDGYIYLKSPGTAVITATSENGLTDTCTITVLDYPTINEGEQKTVEITENQRYGYFYFTPQTDGTYAYYSLSDSDTVGYLLDESFNELAYDDDDGNSGNFRIEYYLEANTTYILKSRFYSSNRTGMFDVQVTRIVDGFIYEIVDGEAIITGYTGTPIVLTIPATIDEYPVTAIGDNAFYFCESLRSVVIPESVTSIGDFAFCNCTSLTSITISEGVTSIGDYAFRDCESLTSITISEGVTSIGESVFEGCSSLVSVTIPSSLTSVGMSAFYDCESLANVYITDLTAWLGIEFSGYENPLCYGGKLYLNGELVKDLVIPEGVTNIGDFAFWCCTSLESVTFPEGVTSIGVGAFDGCTSIENVTIPSSVTSIDYSAFYGCTSITDVYYGGTQSQWNDITIDSYNEYLTNATIHFAEPEESIPEGLVYEIADGEVTIIDYTGSATELVIPSTIEGCPVTAIGYEAFANRRSLTSVTIPEGVTSIGERAFRFCSSLTSVTIPEGVTSIGASAFNRCTSLANITFPESLTTIGKYAFGYCQPLTSITIPEGVTSIDVNPFVGCNNLTSIIVDEDNTVYDSRDNCNAIIETATNTLISGCKTTVIPEGVTSIGVHAFADISSLTSLIISDSVTSIDYSAFYGCSSLTDVYYGGTQEQWNDIAIGSGNSYLTNANIYFTEPEESIPEGLVYEIADGEVTITDYTGSATELVIPSTIEGCPVTSIGRSAFAYCSELESITIPEGVTSIGCGAFAYCFELESITIPEGVTSIGEETFRYCDSLESIIIPESVTSIGDSAFRYCESLTSITIPDGVTSIGDYAFTGCISLESIIIPKSVTSIGVCAFADCDSLTSLVVDENNAVYDSRNNCDAIIETATNTLISGSHITVIPESVTSIGEFAFAFSGLLESVTIPEGITTIGMLAFVDCDALASVTIPESVTTIGGYAFMNCFALESVTIQEGTASIGEYAFAACESLASVTIPVSVTNIDEYAFVDCYALEDVYYGGTQEQWNHIVIGNYNDYLTIATIHFTLPEYLVRFFDFDGTLLKECYVTQGENAEPPTEIPTRESDAQYSYDFAGWDIDFTNVQSDLDVTIVYAQYVNEYMVTFNFYSEDGRTLVYDEQTVPYGSEAVAPQVPAREGYTFAGWDKDFSNITEDMSVTALYTRIIRRGNLSVEVIGGAGFNISINGGTSRPQGSMYRNTKIEIGSTVTVVAREPAGATFIGWINPATGIILSNSLEYTFVAMGNDYINAIFNTQVEGVQAVIFKNDKSKRILDSQYYSAEDTIQFPDAPTQVGYDFAGWSMTEAEIKNAIANGEDVTVVAKWTKQMIYVNVTAVNGTGGGRVLANNALTVTANTAPAGQKFAYWTDAQGNIKSYNASYKFYPTADMEIIAVFVAEDATVEQEILVSVDTIDTTSIADKNVFYFSWYVPTEYTFVKAGILAVNKDNYNEEAFVAGTSDGNVYDRSPATALNNRTGTTSWNKSNVTSGQTWVAKAYVQYRDAEGTIITVYSDPAMATKE